MRVREEKSRLYRTLRKLNMIRPHPSWANFMLARIERGDPDMFEHALRDRAIVIHRPPHPELSNCFRISATTPEATGALKEALIEAAAESVASERPSPPTPLPCAGEGGREAGR